MWKLLHYGSSILECAVTYYDVLQTVTTHSVMLRENAIQLRLPS